MKKVILLITLIILTIILSQTAIADWEVQKVPGTDGTPRRPDLVRYKDIILLVYDETDNGSADVYYVKSTDKGDTWAKQKLSSSQGNQLHQYASIAVSKKNTYVVWQQFPEFDILFRNSRNSGKKWKKIQSLTDDTQSGYSALATNTDSSPQVAADKKWVHVVFLRKQENGGINEVFHMMSKNKGKSWTKPKNISNTTNDCISPKVAVYKKMVFVSWAEDTVLGTKIFFTRSTNQGNTWSTPELLNAAGSPPEFKIDTQTAYTDISNFKKTLIAFFRDPQTYYRISRDAGKSWEQAQEVDTFCSDGMLATAATSTQDLHALCANKGDLNHAYSQDGKTWEQSEVEWKDAGARLALKNNIKELAMQANQYGTHFALANDGNIYFGTHIKPLTVTSTAFNDGDKIPAKYTCDGADVSPQLAWTGTPTGTKSFVVICDDPDAPGGTFVHWVIFNIPATLAGLDENIPKQGTLANGSRQGRNDMGRIGYDGPCPPRGTHRYFYKVYALDIKLGLAAGATKAQVVNAMKGHILAQGELIGRFR